MKTGILMVALSIVPVGCHSSGVQAIKDETNQSVASKVTKDVSGKDTVRVNYGDPTSVSFTDSGNEIWTYEYTKSSPKPINFVPLVGDFVGGEDVNKKHIVFFFGKEGIVHNFTVSSANTEALKNQ